MVDRSTNRIGDNFILNRFSGFAICRCECLHLLGIISSYYLGRVSLEFVETFVNE